MLGQESETSLGTGATLLSGTAGLLALVQDASISK